MNHTKGPWQQSHRKTLNGSYSTEIYDSEGKTIATLAWYAAPYGGKTTTNRHQNARRIVACVNALEGYSTEILENAENIAMLTPDLAEKLMNMERQRDELMKAVMRIVSTVPALVEGGGFIVEHYSPDGECIGYQNIDPMWVVQEMSSIAYNAIEKVKGGAA